MARAGDVRIAVRESRMAALLRERPATEVLPELARMPMSGWALVLFGVSFPFLRLTAHAGLLTAVLALLCLFAWRVERRGRILLTSMDRCVALLALLYLGSSLLGEGEPRVGFLYAAMAAIWFPARDELRCPACRRRLLCGMQAGLFVTSVIGILQYATGRAELKWVDVTRFGDIGGRVVSVFSNPNILAVYLLMVLPCAWMGFFREEEGWRARRRSLAVALVGSACLLLTWSRGAWLAGMIELLFVVIFSGRRPLAAGLLASPFAICLLPWIPANVGKRFLSIRDLGESSVRYRLQTWRGVGEAMLSHPFGVGSGEVAFRAAYLPHAVSGTETVMHAHQLFLQLGLEVGLVGVFVFLLFLWLLLRRVVRDGDRSGGALAVLGVILMGLSDYVWYDAGMAAMFWLMAAMAVSRPAEPVKESEKI